jgi:hypothetical protein
MTLKSLSSAAAILLFFWTSSTLASCQGIESGRILAERLCEKQGPTGIQGFRAVANRPAQSVEGIVSWLRSIPRMMPNHHLTQDEMYALAQYIISLRDNNDRPVPLRNPR